MVFQNYGPDDIKKLLVSIDSHLNQKAQIILIGGTAALLAYKATRLTQDIDTFSKITKALNKAYKLAKQDTGLDIPLSQASVADAPYNFEDRLVPYKDIIFKHLVVVVPEIHDFILMKSVRGYQNDMDVIEEISKKNKINKKTLIERYSDEMDHVIGDKEKLKQNFVVVLARCFGEKFADTWLENDSYTNSRK